MSLLKSYIKEILKESINYEDSQKIEKVIENFRQNLKSEGFDLDNLEFDAYDISEIRDCNEPDFSSLKIGPNLQGLSFNPFGEINQANNFEKFKKYYSYIDSLHNSKHSNKMVKNFHNIIKGAYAIRKAANDSGLKILGSGIFRIALEIPSIPDVVIKIALSKSGRDDNANEIKFSLGQGAKSVRHKENFSNVYSHSKNGSWMIVDREIMFVDVLEGKKPNVLDNLLKNQFKNTMDLFDDLNLVSLHWSGRTTHLFAEYVQHMFNFDDRSLSRIKKSHARKDHDEGFVKSLVTRVKNALGVKGSVISSDYIKMSDSYFKNRLFMFLAEIIGDASDTSPNKKLAEIVVNQIEKKSRDYFRKVFKDFGMLYDQAMTSGISDMHIGNLGVKLGKDGNYRLIFTDIDAGTY